MTTTAILMETRCYVPVVVLTSSDEGSDLIRSYELSVNSYIRKPVDFSELTEATCQIDAYWLEMNRVPPRKQSA